MDDSPENQDTVRETAFDVLQLTDLLIAVTKSETYFTMASITI